jgi:hypothetical protein
VLGLGLRVRVRVSYTISFAQVIIKLSNFNFNLKLMKATFQANDPILIRVRVRVRVRVKVFLKRVNNTNKLLHATSSKIWNLLLVQANVPIFNHSLSLSLSLINLIGSKGERLKLSLFNKFNI